MLCLFPVQTIYSNRKRYLNFEFEWLTLYEILNFWVSKISQHNLLPNQSIHGNISDEKEFTKHCGHGLITLGKWIGFKNSKYFNRFSLMSVSISFNTPQSYVLTLLLEVANQTIGSAFFIFLEKWSQPSLPQPRQIHLGQDKQST